jgi:hypothetical protein
MVARLGSPGATLDSWHKLGLRDRASLLLGAIAHVEANMAICQADRTQPAEDEELQAYQLSATSRLWSSEVPESSPCMYCDGLALDPITGDACEHCCEDAPSPRSSRKAAEGRRRRRRSRCTVHYESAGEFGTEGSCKDGETEEAVSMRNFIAVASSEKIPQAFRVLTPMQTLQEAEDEDAAGQNSDLYVDSVHAASSAAALL